MRKRCQFEIMLLKCRALLNQEIEAEEGKRGRREKKKKGVQMRNRIRVKRMNKWPILTWSNN